MSEIEIDTGWRKENYCPCCGKICDAATDPKDLKNTPSPGDLGICIYCFEIHKFDEKLNLVKCMIHELNEPTSIYIKKMQAAIKYYKNMN